MRLKAAAFAAITVVTLSSAAVASAAAPPAPPAPGATTTLAPAAPAPGPTTTVAGSTAPATGEYTPTPEEIAAARVKAVETLTPHWTDHTWGDTYRFNAPSIALGSGIPVTDDEDPTLNAVLFPATAFIFYDDAAGETQALLAQTYVWVYVDGYTFVETTHIFASSAELDALANLGPLLLNPDGGVVEQPAPTTTVAA